MKAKPKIHITAKRTKRCQDGLFFFPFMMRLTCPKLSELAHMWQRVCLRLQQIQTSGHGQRMISVTSAALTIHERFSDFDV